MWMSSTGLNSAVPIVQVPLESAMPTELPCSSRQRGVTRRRTSTGTAFSEDFLFVLHGDGIVDHEEKVDLVDEVLRNGLDEEVRGARLGRRDGPVEAARGGERSGAGDGEDTS